MTLRFALDTNIVSAAFAAKPPRRLLARLDLHAPSCALPAPVWHELRFGAASLPLSRRRTALERYLSEVLLVQYPILAYDQAAASWHAEERGRLARSGVIPPFVDGQIAAIARVHDLVLVTDNTSDFAPFRGLRVQNWLERSRR